MVRLPDTRADVWYAWVDDCDRGDLGEYESLLNAQERARLGRFAFPSLAREYLVTRALCRLTLSRYAAIAPTDWSFIQNGYGKPEIHPRFSTRLRFNLSNCRTLVACVVTADADAGIDVESVDRPNELLSLADRYFSPGEAGQLRAAPQSEQRDLFFQLWTLKESYIKARGMGLTIPLEQFSFDISGPRISVSFAPTLQETLAGWQFELYRLGERHRMAIALHNKSAGTLAVTVREGLKSLATRTAGSAPPFRLEASPASDGTPATAISPTLLRTSVRTAAIHASGRESISYS